MLLLALTGFGSVAHATPLVCPGDVDSLSAALNEAAAHTGESFDIEITEEGCLGVNPIEVVDATATVTCSSRGACLIPPIRASGGDLAFTGFTFGSVHGFALETTDDNRALFPSFDEVTASLYTDGTRLTVRDCGFTSTEASFAGIVAVDGDLLVQNSTVTNPSNHAIKFYADDRDVSGLLDTVTVSGARDSALLVRDDFGSTNLGSVTSLTLTGGTYSGNEAGSGADLFVSIAGDVTVDGTNFSNSAASDDGAPIQVFGANVSFTGGQLHAMRGITSAVMELTARDSIVITGVEFLDPVAGERVASLTASNEILVSGSTFPLAGRLELTGGHAELVENYFTLPGDLPPDSGLWVRTTSADFTRNRFCGGPIALGLGVVHSDASELFFEQNLFHGLGVDGPLVGAPSGVTIFVDNTFASVNAMSLFEGEASSFTWVNNLVSESPSNFVFDTEPPESLVNFNLWNRSDGAEVRFDNGWGSDDVQGEPGFVLDYDATDCHSLPELASGSPAINTGSDQRFSPDGTRSDIGAIDFGAEADWGDTGDADTGEGESGDTATVEPDRDGDTWVDADDCDPDDAEVHPNATEVVGDGIDQDCDGADLRVDFAGGCGCGTDGRFGLGGALLVAGVLSRRRSAAR